VQCNRRAGGQDESETLEIVELRALPDEPGVFRMFALGQSGLVKARRLVVPRLVYVDSAAEVRARRAGAAEG
jgi:hypothetical protein